jgi:endonuclease/exonuclease/phosphatase family metal-dependent hydrolase
MGSMLTNLLTRRREVPGREAREPTLLALALLVAGLLVLLGACVAGIAALPGFGHGWWALAAVAATLAWLVLRPPFRPRPGAASPTARQRWFGRALRLGRVLLTGLLACWLGLIAWSQMCRGGPPPAPKADPALIRVVTWNIHCGAGEGPPWKRFDWPVRTHALRAAIDQAGPDLLCVQEAVAEQVAFLEEALPGHRRVGVGREGGSAGEHCAIYFNRHRFEEVDGGTFWLEEPVDQPRPGSALDVKRICTWVRLRDRDSGRVLRVYNTHLYLTEKPRREAARLILAHVAAGDPDDAVVLTGDFNAPPAAPSRRLFARAGLSDSAERAGRPGGARTFQLYGIPLRSLDAVLVGPGWRARNHHILDVKPGNTFPSDHFGVLADLELQE